MSATHRRLAESRKWIADRLPGRSPSSAPPTTSWVYSGGETALSVLAEGLLGRFDQCLHESTLVLRRDQHGPQPHTPRGQFRSGEEGAGRDASGSKSAVGAAHQVVQAEHLVDLDPLFLHLGPLIVALRSG